MKNFIIENVFKVINQAGYNAWFVGGCVRDNLMKIKNNDYDICTNCPLEVIKTIFNNIVNIFENPFSKIYVVGLIIKNGNRTEHIDISTMCPVDFDKSDEINLTNKKILTYNELLIYKDAMRRDFTINALYEDIDGNIIDPTGLGISDVKNSILRFVGEDFKTKLITDPLIMFRFIRFLSTKDLVSYETLKSIKSISENLDFNKVSKEHKLSELIKIISGKNWMNVYFYEYFEASGIFKYFGFDKIFEQLESCNQTYEFHLEGSQWMNKETGEIVDGETIKDFNEFIPVRQSNVLYHTLYVVKNMCKLLENETDKHKRFILNLAAFLHDIGKPKCNEINGSKVKKFKVNDIEIKETIPIVYNHDFIGKDIAYDFCKNLGINSNDCKLIRNLVDNHMKILQLEKIKSSSQIFKFVKLPYFDYLYILAQADDKASIPINKNKMTIEQIMSRKIIIYIDGKKEVLIKDLINMDNPKPILNGKDLINKGIKDGQLIGKMLDKALDFQINEGITDKVILLNKIKGVKLSLK